MGIVVSPLAGLKLCGGRHQEQGDRLSGAVDSHRGGGSGGMSWNRELGDVYGQSNSAALDYIPHDDDDRNGNVERIPVIAQTRRDNPQQQQQQTVNPPRCCRCHAGESVTERYRRVRSRRGVRRSCSGGECTIVRCRIHARIESGEYSR